MKHFIQYLKPTSKGHAEDEIRQFRISSKYSISRLLGNALWVIGGQDEPRAYFLFSVFIVDSINVERHLVRQVFFASGKKGVLFNPPLSLSPCSWFSPFMKSQLNFSLGFREIKEDQYRDELIKIARTFDEEIFKEV